MNCKYINLDFLYEAKQVIHKTVKLEYATSIQRLYLGVQEGISGRLILKANNRTIFDAIVSPSRKKQIIEIDFDVSNRLKIEGSFLLFGEKEVIVIEPPREEGEEPSVDLTGEGSPSIRTKNEKLLTLLLFVNV